MSGRQLFYVRAWRREGGSGVQLHTPVISALERWRQGYQEFKARLGYRRLYQTNNQRMGGGADRKSFRNAPIKEDSEIPALSFRFS